MAFAVILALPLGWSAIPLMLVVVIGLLDALVVKVLMLAPWSIRAANWHTDGSWRLTLVQGREVEARLSPTTFVGLGCIALVFELGRWRWSTLPLCSDSLDAETLRRLRQRLQIEGGRRDATPGRLESDTLDSRR